MKKNETGALAIETVLVLTFFMLSIISIMFMAVIIKVQATMQYAVSQTAKEISGYYYLIDKVGLASVLSGQVTDTDGQHIENLNNTIDDFVTLVGDSSDLANDITSTDVLNPNDIANLASDTQTLVLQAHNFGKIFMEQIKDGSMTTQFAAVLKFFGKTMLNETLTQVAAPYVCKGLMKKYLTSGDINDYCNAAGLNWDNHYYTAGGEYMDFSGTELLVDGRSIKIDVVYTINTKNLTFGLVEAKLKFHQCASTAAWVKPNGSGSLKSIADAIEFYQEPTQAPTTAPGGSP